MVAVRDQELEGAMCRRGANVGERKAIREEEIMTVGEVKSEVRE